MMLTKENTISISGKYDDLAKLSLLTEDILLEHLKSRYENDLIYVRRFNKKKANFMFFFSDILRRYSRCS